MLHIEYRAKQSIVFLFPFPNPHEQSVLWSFPNAKMATYNREIKYSDFQTVETQNYRKQRTYYIDLHILIFPLIVTCSEIKCYIFVCLVCSLYLRQCNGRRSTANSNTHVCVYFIYDIYTYHMIIHLWYIKYINIPYIAQLFANFMCFFCKLALSRKKQQPIFVESKYTFIQQYKTYARLCLPKQISYFNKYLLHLHKV